MKDYSKEDAKIEITKLVEDFKSKINVIKKGDTYKEANVEDEFIKPLFKYLNWNISSEGIKNIADREFIVQAKGKGGKEPDYLLQLDGKPCFYMEAKHPKYDLFKEIKYIWQAYSYAYSTQSSSMRKKVDFALLTDFEEFRFFDCTFKADPHTVNNFVIFDWKYIDYIDKFDLLWQYFAKENVRNDSLNNLYKNEKQIKENRIPPDKAFLDDLDNEKTGWRITLAKDIKKYNPELSSDFITSVIQLIIDRFVFIKVLSDREIEDDFLAQVIEQIDRASMKSEEGIINETCKDLFARMNKTYNGSIFEERKELDIVKLSNKTLHSILKSLLPENSRYNFKVIPVEILGTIYEQFLGKIVSTTDKRATIEYKPEVRKAGGVYYTPQYIVEYIVENTVGVKLSECKNINDVLNIKICDPACGSGSFLLGAYDKLINHIIHYFADKVHHNKDITKKERELFYHDNDGNIRLTAKIKRDILRNCIYGVDIDPQAVEVTKMSLSLKALEYTRHDELYNEVDLFHEKVLPDLSENIKCGNSLIGTDFFTPGLFTDVEEMKKINAFDWDKEFREIFNPPNPPLLKGEKIPSSTGTEKGFDVVIGNPPYGFHQIHSNSVKPYFKSNFKSSQGSFEHYFLFYEKSLKLLTHDGLHSFIVPITWLTIPSALSLRNYILENYSILNICWLPELVFENAQVNTLISIIKKTQLSNETNTKIDIYDSLGFTKPPVIERIVKQITFITSNYSINIFESSDDSIILESIEKVSKQLSYYAKPCSGYNPYEVGKGQAPDGGLQTKETVETKPYHSDQKINDQWKPEIVGRDLSRYYVNITGKRWIKYGSWLAASRDPENFHGKRILVQEITGGKDKRIIAAFYNGELYHSRDIIPIKVDEKFPHSLYLLGIINSKLITWYHHKRNPKAQKGLFPKVLVSDLSKLPIRTIDFSNPSEKQSHDLLVSLVDQMLEAQKKYHAKKDTTDEHTCKIMQQRIDSIDKQIDELVYRLYGLTDDEIKIVEGERNR